MPVGASLSARCAGLVVDTMVIIVLVNDMVL